jgi:hypothetical protein
MSEPVVGAHFAHRKHGAARSDAVTGESPTTASVVLYDSHDRVFGRGRGRNEDFQQ